MKTLVLLALLVALVSFIGCEKKNSVSFKGPSGKTASITVK
jgi:hypothetical protein